MRAPLKVTVDTRTLGSDGKGVTVRDAVPVFMTHDNADVYLVTTKSGYQIKATAWHDFYTQRGKLKLKDLNVGDSLLIQSGKGQFGNLGSEDLGLLLGLIAGDGHFTNRGGQQAACLGLWGENRGLSDRVMLILNSLIAGEQRYRPVSAVSVDDRGMQSFRSVTLANVLERDYGFNAYTKLVVPDVVWKGTEACVRGYLHGIFQTDGTVCVNEASNTCSVRLSSASESFLGEIQMLLANFGVYSSIRLSMRRRPGWSTTRKACH